MTDFEDPKKREGGATEPLSTVKASVCSKIEKLTVKADEGDTAALLELGRIYSDNRDFDKALDYYTRASDLGCGEASWLMSFHYQEGYGVAKDPDMAVKYLRKAAKQGDVMSLETLARAYRFGDSKLKIEKNPVAAYRYYRKLAKNGNYDACVFVGMQHISGGDTRESKEEGCKWLMKATGYSSERIKHELHQYYRPSVNGPRDDRLQDSIRRALR